VAALKQWRRDTWAGLRTSPACVSMLAQSAVLVVTLTFFGSVYAAAWLVVWHLLLAAAPFIDRQVRKHWLVGPVTPHPAVLRRGGRLGVGAYVGLHLFYGAAYGLAGAWLWRRFGNVSALDLVLPVVSG
jgi:hypothetical protein